MPHNQIELILSRQLADCLSMPTFLVDTHGNLIFYNEPAEQLLGLRFEETGSMPVERWSTIFKPKDEQGNPLNPEDLPLVQTLANQKPAHGQFWIHSFSGDFHEISVTSFPVIGRSDRFLGAIAIFWRTLEP
jgi:PAS domain-containing protein